MFKLIKMLKRNAIVHLASVLWENAKGHRKLVVLYAVLAGVAILVSLLTPLVIARLMQAVQNTTGDELISSSKNYLGIFMVLGVAFWLLHGPSRVIEISVAFVVRRAFQMALFHKVTALPMSWHRDHHSGETIDQVAKASQALGDFTESGFEVIHIAVRFVGAVAVLSWFMPMAGVAVVCLGIIAAITIVIFDRKLVVYYAKINKGFNEVASAIQDYLTNVATVISLRLEGRTAREVTERTEKIFPTWRSSALLSELKWCTTSRFVDLTYAVVLFGFIYIKAKSGAKIEIGVIYALSEYLRSIGDSFFQFTGRYGDLVVKSTRLRGVEHIEEAFDKEVKATDEAVLPPGWRTIEIRDLTFSHDGASDQTAAGVSGVNLTLQRGRSYAFVGESGSGKSTVLKLLRGLHRTDSVSVSCDGVVLPFGLSHVAHKTTLIPQDPEIFAESILRNVTMGVDAPETEIRRAIRLARFESVLARLPKGLHTSIAEKGVSLSGGEKQRLAVARGLFFVKESGSDIVLLDEPTSSVDIYNEKLIYEGLLREYRDHCVVSALHKFNLLHLFDEVVVFASGKVVEHGNVDQLLAQNGEFARLWRTFVSEEKVVG